MAEKNKMGGNKTAHWISREYMIQERSVNLLVCSKCKAEFSFDYETGISAGLWNFCPNCGAKIEEK